MYRQYVAVVYRYCFHQIGKVEDAEDLTATTFSRALTSFAQYDSNRGSLAAWLFGIARNCIREHRRHPYDFEQLTSELPDRQALPEMQLLSVESAAALQRAIWKLPPDQREALALRFFGELRTDEVAAVLGKSKGAIKMLIHRAVMTLRDCSEREDWR